MKVNGFSRNIAGLTLAFFTAATAATSEGKAYDYDQASLPDGADHMIADTPEKVAAFKQVNESLQKEHLTRADVAQLQTALLQSGYDAGIIDGLVGRRTVAGLTEFLEDHPQSFSAASEQVLDILLRFGDINRIKHAAAQNSDLIIDIYDRIEQRQNADRGEMIALQRRLSVLGLYEASGFSGAFDRATRHAARRMIEHYYEPVLNHHISPDQKHDILHVLTTNGFGVSKDHIERAWCATHDYIDAAPSPDAVALCASLGDADPDADALNNAPAGKALIVIDLGHGAYNSHGILDRGAVARSNGLTEMVVVDSVGGALATELRQKGYDVAFTRHPGERFYYRGTARDTLPARPAFAHELAQQTGHEQQLIFISLHADSHTNARVRGAHVYAQRSSALGGLVNRAKNATSYDLASKLSTHFNIGASRTNVRTSDFSVLRNFEARSLKPEDDKNVFNGAILLELGYLSNDADAHILNEAKNDPSAFAESLARGIHAFIFRQQQEEHNSAARQAVPTTPYAEPSV